jgi:glycosyltransferase involved in cell wall biosynthesis
MLFIRRLLLAMGFDSRIFVHHRDPRLGADVEEAGKLGNKPGQLLLVHHSMGHDLQDWICSLRMPRMLIWHNITPPELLPDEHSRLYARLGLDFLDRFRLLAVGAIANSSFSADVLTARGWEAPEILPLLVDLERFRDHREDPIRSIEEAVAGQRILFVGRFAPHKNQLRLVDVADRLCAAGLRDFTVDLVGSAPEGDAYVEAIRERIAALALDHRVLLHGHLSDEKLRSLYRSADVYCSLSEHEGFGMPLVEAMEHNVAVVAHGSGSIGTTLGDSGVLLRSVAPEEAAAAVLRLLREPDWRRATVRAQRARLQALEPAVLARRLAAILARHGAQARSLPQTPQPPAFQVEGPCETTYSLAIVNRELARGLERLAPGTTAALPTEGPGGYVVDEAALRRMPDLGEMVARSRHRPGAHVVLRNLYPPRVHDMDGDVNLMQFAWEESLVPPTWVAGFNRWLDGMVVPSRFTARRLRDSGVALPIAVAPHGLSHALAPARTMPDGPVPGLRTFLHVSSCFPRKGADVLLAAFREAFSADDAVELLIKTFPNPHNDVARRVVDLLAADPRHPRVRVIDRDLSVGEMADLYSRSHVLVSPSRGEGFGLPVAEAMAHGLPVIVTGGGAMAEFVPDGAGVKLPWRWAASGSHVAPPGSLWQEPDLPHLVEALREMAKLPAAALAAMGKVGREHVSRSLSWDAAAAQIAHFSAELSSATPAPRPRLGWISTWGIKCGIATYSQHLVPRLRAEGVDVTVLGKAVPGAEDEPGVVRCWGFEPSAGDMQGVVQEATRRQLDVVVVQFQFGLYHRPALSRVLAELLDRGIAVVMTMHSVRDVVREGRTVASLDELGGVLSRIDRLLVHSVSDLNLLARGRRLDNATFFPHGCEARPAVDAKELRRRIGLGDRPSVGMFGFLLPNKGVVEALEAWPLVLARHPRAVLLLATALFDAPESADTLQRCRAAIERLRLQDSVVQITEFLPEEEAAVLLEACDLTLFPYRHSAEGASGAVRLALAVHRPVLCTRQPIFEDLAGTVTFLEGEEPAALAEAVSRALGDPTWLEQAARRQERWVEATQWPTLARRLDGLLCGLVRERRAAAQGTPRALASAPPRSASPLEEDDARSTG